MLLTSLLVTEDRVQTTVVGSCVVRDVGDGEDPEYCSCGGGGGGVFVNSEEPIGRGYGGGGQNDQNGYSGVVLIEIFNN